MFALNKLSGSVAVIAVVATIVLAATHDTSAQKSDAPPSFGVEITNTPLPVRDVENPARQPFQAQLPFTVPANKRLVIEYFSAHARGRSDCTLMVVRLSTSVNGVRGDHVFAPTLTNSNITSGNEFIVSDQTRLYADSGTTVDLNRAGTNGCDISPQLSFATRIVSGYLVDVPEN